MNQTNNFYFDILKLHAEEEDIDMKGSWIKVSGSSLNIKLKKILNELVEKKGYKKYEIYDEFARIFNCHRSTSKRHFLVLNKELGWVSLYFIRKLLVFWKEKLHKSKEEFNKKRMELQNTYEFLKVGQNRSPKIKCIKTLNETLCKIAGAHAADGHLNRKSGLVLEDADKVNVEKFASWIHESFGLKSKIKHAQGNAWRVEIYNKIISRYLQKFFGFPIGKKTRTVSEPEIIKNSLLKYRKAFALGVMTFDGSVCIDGVASLEVYSENLINSICNILKYDGFNVKMKRYKNSGFTIRISSNFDKIIEYFEVGTRKFNILNFHLGNYECDINNKQLTIIENIIKDLRVFDLITLSHFCKKKTNTLVAYLFILRNKKKIKRTNNGWKIYNSPIVDKNRVSFLINKKYRDAIYNHLNYQNFSYRKLSETLKVSKSTPHLWLRKNVGIRCDYLQKLCIIANLSFEDVIKDSKVSAKQEFYEINF